MTIQALKDFMLDQGATPKTVLMEWDKIWAMNAKIIDPVAKRFNAVSTQTTSILHLLNLAGDVEGKSSPYHPKIPELGT